MPSKLSLKYNFNPTFCEYKKCAVFEKTAHFWPEHAFDFLELCITICYNSNIKNKRGSTEERQLLRTCPGARTTYTADNVRTAEQVYPIAIFFASVYAAVH